MADPRLAPFLESFESEGMRFHDIGSDKRLTTCLRCGKVCRTDGDKVCDDCIEELKKLRKE